MKTRVFLTAPGAGSQQYYEEMESFLRAFHPFGWTSDHVKLCWVFEVRREADDWLCGYVWLNYVAPEPEPVMEVHGCIAPWAQKQVWSRTLLHTIADNIVEETGVERYIAQCPTNNLKKFWRLLGWEIGHLFATYRVPPQP